LRCAGHPAGGAGRAAALLLACALAGVAALAWRYVPPAEAPPAVAGEPAAAFVAPERAAAFAEELRGAGVRGVEGGALPLPPAAEPSTRYVLDRIHREATRRAEAGPVESRDAHARIAAAAARDDLHMPGLMRARFRTTDGRAVVWIQDAAVPASRDEFFSAERACLQGIAAMRRDGRVAATLALLLAGLVTAWRGGAEAGRAMVLRALAFVAGAAVLFAMPDPLGHGSAAALAPLLVCVAWSPGTTCVAGAAVLAALQPDLYLPCALAFAATTLLAWPVRLRA
jgi:hypothetical protein